MRGYFLILLFAVAGTYANGKSVPWHDGVLVLKDHQVLVGEVVIEPAFDVILFRSEDHSSFCAIDKVDYVVYHDAVAGLNRKFLALQTENRARDAFQLYEVVIQGPLSVVRKPRGSYIPDLDDVNSFEYFVLNGEHSLVRVSRFNKDVYPTIEAYFTKAQLKSFLHQRKLDPQRLPDALRLIQHYNDWRMASASAL